MNIRIKNHHKILPATFALGIAYLISYLMLKGVGAPRSFFHSIMLVFLITVCSASKKSFRYFVLPLTVIYAFYAPIGLTYGAISYDFLIAGLSTDLLETKEFFQQIPYKHYLFPFIIIIGLFTFRIITIKYNIHYYKNRTFLITALIIMLAAQAPLFFLKNFKESLENVYAEQQILNEAIQEISWGKSKLVHSQYENYILIIGESARRDYHHAYGYPINNTPFMSSAKGILINGLTGGGQTTVPSLKAMLTLSDKATWEADYSKTIVGLAKSAGLKTYWLSNQGYLGTHDTPISAIAKSSDTVKFLKYGGHESVNTSDFELLDYLPKIIEDHPHEKKLIVIHLYGSHLNSCDRLEDYHLIHQVNDPYYDYMNCYISTIHKTDSILQKIYNLMSHHEKKLNTSFSMLYFADHGHIHHTTPQTMFFNNSALSKSHYDIPLFMTSSNHQEQTTCTSFKSGLNFTNGLGNWMGIQNKFLDPHYSLFDCSDDPDDFGLAEKLQYITPDYPIDLRGK